MPPSSDSSGVRLAELMAALSLATDLGMGQPLEFALESCLLSGRLGRVLGLSQDDLRDVYYQSLLRYIGCNAETYSLSAVLGDEIALRQEYARVDTGNTSEVLRVVLKYLRFANQGASPLQMAAAVVQGLLGSQGLAKENFNGHCEVAERLAQRLGFGAGLQQALGQLYERWDGKGLPGGLKGEKVALAVRVVTLAQDAVIFRRMEGLETAVQVVRKRRGGAYDPAIADCFCANVGDLFADTQQATWDSVLAMEPGSPIVLSNAELDNACLAMADFADLKSPYTLGHSRAVAELAKRAGQLSGLEEAEQALLYRAGLLHDLGRVGVSAGIWVKAGVLSEREWEQVRLHTYYTERVLARPGPLARIGALAALHHERLDGSGYHRGAVSHMLSPAARILAAADVYQALTEPRAHRPAFSPDAAVAELLAQAQGGKLDAQAVKVVLQAAGQQAVPLRTDYLGGLTEREVVVLRLIARGNPTKKIASLLSVSPKTIDNHIQHIYEKLGISSRAAATLFAVENGLLT